ncbi:hypothetical protein [Lichenifustis flavocetrariae]|uniref:Uncharacterized protein n=1 Tax=Lichenifustis flavocetrariae TaxID=2949735 RepID=A0AA41Z062_9HYPH|nr:hypothetical protein [Lichenifustis flavocetrariae]MCW6506897.1 hypothetical protein [Lichenifustis flavocetrariae]
MTSSPHPDDSRDPALLADLCIDAEQPMMIATLIRENATVAQARTRLDVLATLRPTMAMVEHRPGITAEIKDRVLSGRLSIAQARTAIFDAMADADEANLVDNKKPTGNGAPDGRTLMRESMLKQIEEKHGPEAAAKARAKLNERK